MNQPDLRRLHSTHSSLREKIVEHRFIADVLRAFWARGIVDVEILRSEFDAGGYDLVLSAHGLTRHIQLKAVLDDGRRTDVGVNLNLSKKPSGCVVWIDVSATLDVVGYRWFGAAPGLPLPPIHDLKVGKHTKGTSTGKKNQRPNHRELKKSAFTKMSSLEDLIETLVGRVP